MRTQQPWEALFLICDKKQYTTSFTSTLNPSTDRKQKSLNQAPASSHGTFFQEHLYKQNGDQVQFEIYFSSRHIQVRSINALETWLSDYKT